MLTIALVPFTYFLGTFPSALLVARAHGHDVFREGSGNPGASNVARVAGWRAGALVAVLDFGKGALAAGAGLLVGGRAGAWVLGLAAVVGHVWPVTRRFRGGRGVATAAGALMVLFPLIVVVLVPVWFVLARVLHKASIASLAVTVAVPVAVAILGYDRWELAIAIVLAAIVLVRHVSNIRRLVHGQEHPLPGGSVPPGEDEQR